jgi:ketosteroid isomerase-like protein
VAAGEPEFDFHAFKRALEQRDVDRWVEFYADNAEWLEYRPFDPPRTPNRVLGKAAIGELLRHLSAIDMALAVSNEVIACDRAAFRVDVTLGDGKQIIEHVIIEVADGKIVRQVDVEAWD